jgi:hypothetical protein
MVTTSMEDRNTWKTATHDLRFVGLHRQISKQFSLQDELNWQNPKQFSKSLN